MSRFILPSPKAGLFRLHPDSRAARAGRQCALTERRAIERRHQVSDFRHRDFRLRAAAQVAGLGAYDLDCVTGSNFWSPELKAIAGLAADKDEISLAQVRELIHPDDRDRVSERLEDSLDPQGDGLFEDEYRLVRPDGTIRWVKVRGRTFFTENGHGRRPLGASGMVIDITERRAAEALLREQSEELRLALRVGNSGTFQWDARTHEHRWCNEMLALYGLEREEFGGRDEDWLACLLPEDRAPTMAVVENSLKTGEYAATFRIRRHDNGHIRWMSGRGKMYFDAEGAPVRMVGINVDITEQKQAEERLQESETRFRLMADAAPAMIWLAGTDRNCTWFNQPWLALTGRTLEEELGYGWAGRIHPEDVERRLRNYETAFDRRQPFSEEYRIRRHDGEYRWLLDQGVPRFEGEAFAGYIGSAIDITERKAAEARIKDLNTELECRVAERTAELRRANEALLESNTELKQFAHATAHDLQTPLRSIAGFSQLLQREVHDRRYERVDEWASLVVANPLRLQTLIQELLSYTRLESQGLPFQEVDLRSLVDEVLESLDELIGETGAEVTCGDLPSLPVGRTQMFQVLQSLVENGIKYNQSRPPKVSIACDLQEDRWVFSVTDNGIGIDPKHHERIFEIFRRLHTYRQVPGNGIGLALCRRIVERHGGHVWVSSQPGQGSTFYFSLPANRDTAP